MLGLVLLSRFKTLKHYFTSKPRSFCQVQVGVCGIDMLLLWLIIGGFKIIYDLALGKI